MTTVNPAGKLSPADWATAVTLYSRGEKSVRDLADMFGVSAQAIHKGLNKRGVTKGARIADVENESEDAATAAHRERVKAAHGTADRYSKYNDAIALLTFKKIMEANTSGVISNAHADVLTLKNGMAIIAKARAEAWDMHKIEELLEQDEALAELNVGEYSPEEIQAIQDANEEHYQASMEDIDDLMDDDDDILDDDDDDDD